MAQARHHSLRRKTYEDFDQLSRVGRAQVKLPLSPELLLIRQLTEEDKELLATFTAGDADLDDFDRRRNIMPKLQLDSMMANWCRLCFVLLFLQIASFTPAGAADLATHPNGLRHLEGALDATGNGGVIVADYTLWRPLKYLQHVEGRRPDVLLQIVDPFLAGDALVQFVSAQLVTRPVYLAAIEPPGYYDLDRLRKAFTVTAVGPIFELRAAP